MVEHRARLLAVIALLAISAGGFLHLIGAPGIGDHVWAAAIVLLAAELMFGSRPPGDSIEM